MPGPTGGWKYTHLSGAGTTTILQAIGASQAGAPAAGPGNTGQLAGIWVNSAGTSVTVYDSPTASGLVLAVFGATTGQLVPNDAIQLTAGLTVVIVGAADVTLAWA
jgi:hypothetical protein